MSSDSAFLGVVANILLWVTESSRAMLFPKLICNFVTQQKDFMIEIIRKGRWNGSKPKQVCRRNLKKAAEKATADLLSRDKFPWAYITFNPCTMMSETPNVDGTGTFKFLQLNNILKACYECIYFLKSVFLFLFTTKSFLNTTLSFCISINIPVI